MPRADRERDKPDEADKKLIGRLLSAPSLWLVGAGALVLAGRGVYLVVRELRRRRSDDPEI